MEVRVVTKSNLTVYKIPGRTVLVKRGSQN